MTHNVTHNVTHNRTIETFVLNVSRELGFAQDWVENPEIFQDPFWRFREKSKEDELF